MSLFTDGLAVIRLGETLVGTDDGRLVNTRMEGREGWVSHEDFVNAGSAAKIGTGTNGIRSKIRVMRNTSGVVLYAGEIAKINPALGIAGFGKASAKAAANDRLCVIVDPTLPSTGVPVNDLFIAFIEGPALVLAPAAGVALAPGDKLIAGALGRAAVGGALAGSTALIIGTFLTDTQLAAANAGALIPCTLKPVGW